MMMFEPKAKYSARLKVIATVFGALALLLATPVLAGGLEDSILTANGQVASLSTNPIQSRLVLHIGDETLNVPGSDSSETTPLGLLRSRTGEIHLFWLASDINGLILQFSSRIGDAWDGPHTLLAGGKAVVFQRTPHLLVAADRLSVSLGDDALDLERQMVHVAWREDGIGLRYSAFVLRNGRYVGWNEIVTVSSAFRQVHVDTEPVEFDDQLLDLATVNATPEGALLLTVADDEKGRVGTLRLGAVSLAAEVLADSVYEHLLDSADLFDPENLSALSDEIRGHIVLVGSTLDLDDSMSDFFSERIPSWIEQNGGGFGWDLDALAGATRAESLDLGQSVYRSTLQTSDGGEIPVFDLVDFLDSNGHRDDFGRLMRLSVTADLVAPTGVGENFDLHVSDDGSTVALSWIDADGEQVHWIENRGEGWSAEKTLETSDSLQASDIVELIKSSIR